MIAYLSRLNLCTFFPYAFTFFMPFLDLTILWAESHLFVTLLFGSFFLHLLSSRIHRKDRFVC